MALIDIGSDPIERLHSMGVYTLVDRNNPANAPGTLDTIKIWANEDLENCKIATFYIVSGTNLSTRDIVTIGSVTSHSEQTFTEDIDTNPISLTVEAGDYIGIYYTSGSIERTSNVGVDALYFDGDGIPSDNREFLNYPIESFSFYGTGITVDKTNVILFGGNF